MRKIVLVYIMLVCGQPSVLSQENNSRYVNFGVKEGLIDNFAYCATQDHLGYMWFGTPSGLYRYDGHIFRPFRSPVDRPGRAISNILQSIFTAADGTIWLGGFNTLQWYDPAKNVFWGPDYSKPAVVKLCNAYIFNFAQDKAGNVWLATGNDYFFRFNKADSTIKSFGNQYPVGASKSAIKIFLVNDAVWVLHQEGIYQFSMNDQFMTFYDFSGGGLSNGIYDQQGNTLQLVTLSNGVVQFDFSKKKFEKIYPVNEVLKKNNLFSVVKDKIGNSWIGSYPLFKVDSSNRQLLLKPVKNESEYDLKTSKIGNLYFDRENNLWICGYGGLSMLPWQNSQVTTISIRDATTGNSIEPLGVIAVPGSEDLLIANSNSAGLLYYNSKNRKLETIHNPAAKDRSGKAITGIIPAPDGGIYLSDDLHFFKYSTEKKQMVVFPLKDQNGKPLINAGRNVIDKNGMVYISSLNNGFYRWNTISNKLHHFNKQDVDRTAAAGGDNAVYPCFVDRDENIWFTGSAGVYQLNAKDKEFYHYAYREEKNIPVMTSSSFITQDKAGHYWITTNNNGLYELYFDQGKEYLKNYTLSSGIGLPSDYLLKIKPDMKDSCLWISFSGGLLKFDPYKKVVLTILKKQNGLSADDGGYTFNITPGNKLVQLHYGSMNIINLNNYRFNKTAPAVVINSVKVLDEERRFELDSTSPEITCNYDENFLQIEFAALVFNNSNQTQYAYMLEGADKEWVYSGSRNSVSYSGLADGEYTFRVKAANNDGVWSEKELRLKINIRPVFYKSWWFIMLTLMLCSSLFYFYYRLRIRQVKKEEILKAGFRQQIAETEMKALRAQMNPHFIFNSLNSIQKYILQNDHFAASQYLTKFSRLIRLILDHSNQDHILLSSELDLLRLYIEMESLRFENKFNYKITIDPAIHADNIAIPSMLVQPYVENAIWHGLLHKENKGNLLLAIYKSQTNDLVVEIEDDGVGREKANELKSKQVLRKKSYGMKITEDRIAIINSTQKINATCNITDLKDESGNAGGTKVKLTIPINNIKNADRNHY